ncbi:MAG: hypothetical protein MZU91_00655 [Desulfosudis oleivorans]|nr:hypothetical protein [Desulfosudis oleivorans]
MALIIGSILLIKQRMNKPDQKSAYKDWLLLGLVLGTGGDRHGRSVDAPGRLGGAVLHHLFHPPDADLVHLRLPAVLEAGPPGLPHGGHDVCGVCRA